MAEHDFTVELYYDGAWHLVDAREGGGSTISWGTTNPGVETDPAKVLTDLDNLSRWYSPRSIASPLHGKIGQNTPIRFTLDGGDPYVLDAAEWRPQRSADDQDAWTSIQAAGVLRRIGRGTSNIASAVTRAALGVAPANLLAYWPLEGNTDAATQGTDSMYGREDVSVTWNDSALLVGSLPLPKVISVDETYPKNGQGKLNGVVPSSGATSTTWTVACWFIAETTYTADYNSVNVIEWGALPAGSAGRAWEVAISSDFVLFANNGIFIQMDNSGRAFLDSFDVFDGQPHHMAVTLVQSGSNISVALYVDGSLADTGSANGYTLRPVDLIKIGARPESDGDQNPNMWVGGVGVWDVELTSDEVAALYAAYDGYRGETAADRFTRLCLENGITPTVVGTAAESVPMGPQVPRTLLQEFHEIVRTDDAHIFETRGSTNALTMVCGHAKLNVEPSLTLSYNGDIVPGLQPVVGDVGLRNDVIAKDPQGVARRVIQETGPRNVQNPEDDPQGVYRYDTKIDVNPSTPAGLADAAGWRVHQGTYDGTWYATVVVDLDAAPALITAVNALLPGSLIALQDLPDDEALDTVHLLVLGFKDTVRAFRRTREIFCAPGEPLRVGVLAETSGDTDPFVGHLDTDGSEVMSTNLTQIIADGMEGVGAWTPFDSTFVLSTAQKRSGAGSGLMTVVGTPSQATVRSKTFSVTPGTPVTGGLWAYSVAGYSSVYAVFDWYDSSMSYLGTNGGLPAALAAGTWERRVATADPPAGAVYAQFGPTLGSNPPNGTAVFIDDATVGGTFLVGTNAGPFWTQDVDDFPFDVLVGGQRVTLSAIGAAISETFTRTVSNGFGMETTTGLTYAVSGGSLSDYSVNGTTGRMSLGTLSVQRRAILTGIDIGDFDVTVVSTISAALTGSGAQGDFSLRVRYTDTSNFVDILIFRQTSGATMAIRSRVAGVDTVSSFPSVPGSNGSESITMRLKCERNALYGWAWLTSGSPTPEPLVTLTGLTLPPAGGVEVNAVLNASVTNSLPVVAGWDSLVTTNPQVFTIHPTGYRPEYPIPAGADVIVQQPIILTQ